MFQRQFPEYLRAIAFPCGVDQISQFLKMSRRNKTYVPVSVLKREAKKERERLEGAFVRMIFKVMAVTEGARNSIYYPIAELVTNIFEHSRHNRGYVFSQFILARDFSICASSIAEEDCQKAMRRKQTCAIPMKMLSRRR